MALNLKQLEAFVWVADLGSFRRAADRLNTTQPNISARIAALESLLKVSLMERDAGSVRLTAKGARLLDHARNVLRATETLVEASEDPGLIEGTLRLGVTEIIVHTWLRQFLRVLKDRLPNIVVELTVDMSVNLEAGLFDRSIDLALQNGPFQRKTTGEETLGAYPLIWVGSPALGLAGDVSITDLAQFPVLTHARDTRHFRDVAAYFATRPDLAVRLVPSSNLAACLHMTINEMGVATLPSAMVAREIARGELVQLSHDWTPDDMHFSARHDRERSALYVHEAAGLARDVAAEFLTGSGHGS